LRVGLALFFVLPCWVSGKGAGFEIKHFCGVTVSNWFGNQAVVREEFSGLFMP